MDKSDRKIIIRQLSEESKHIFKDSNNYDLTKEPENVGKTLVTQSDDYEKQNNSTETSSNKNAFDSTTKEETL